MKRLLTVCALCLALAAPSANAGVLTHSFDISGLPSEGTFGANFPTLTHSFGVEGHVILVEFDIEATMTAPSWSEELQIAVDTPEDTSFDGDIDMSLWGGVNNSNPFASFGSLPAFSYSSNGDVFLTLYESFNDATPNPDAVYGQGSTVRVQFERIVPEPASCVLLGVSMLALVARTRRRLA